MTDETEGQIKKTSPNTVGIEKAPKDLHPIFLKGVDDKECISGDPEKLSCMIQTKTIETINWYIKKKWWPKLWSRFLRFWAIIAVIIGGLIPVMGQDANFLWFGKIDITWGYIAFAIGAALVMIDKLFGFSSAWMRFINTQIQLQQALAEFQMNWAILKNQPPEEEKNNDPDSNHATDDLTSKQLQCLKSFQMEVWDIVEKETQVWITEFRSSLALLEKRAQAGQKKINPAGN